MLACATASGWRDKLSEHSSQVTSLGVWRGQQLAGQSLRLPEVVAFASVLVSRASSTAHQIGQREIPLKTLRPRHHY